MLCIFCYNCIYKRCGYLLFLIANNATANELRWLNHKTNKQKYIKIEFDKSLEVSLLFYQMTTNNAVISNLASVNN